jgi:hypothetical protein
MGHRAVMRPVLDSGEPEASAFAFERVLNTEEAAALLQIHRKHFRRWPTAELCLPFASALDEWLRSGACSKRHSCR